MILLLKLLKGHSIVPVKKTTRSTAVVGGNAGLTTLLVRGALAQWQHTLDVTFILTK